MNKSFLKEVGEIFFQKKGSSLFARRTSPRLIQNRSRSLFLLILLVLGWGALALVVAQTQSNDYLSKILSAMSYDQKIGQLVIYSSSSDEVPYEELKRYYVGGVCLIEGSLGTREFKKNRGNYAWGLRARNVRYPADLERYSSREIVKMFHKTVTQLQVNAPLVQMKSEAFRIPMFVAGDFEGGEFPSLAWGISDIPSLMALSQSRKCGVVYTAGEAIGAQMRALGFNMNLAPVAELHSGIAGDMMGERASSSNAKITSEAVIAFYQGLKSAGIISIAKHFPGHGDATANPHFVVPTTNYSSQALEQAVEPFVRLYKVGVEGFMSAHVCFPKLSVSFKKLPFSLHPTLLRNVAKKYDFEDSLWVTDELFNMKAPARSLGYDEPIPFSAYYQIAFTAVSAGHDIILIRDARYIKEAVRALKDYYRDKPSELERAVRKVLSLKMKVYPNLKASRLDETQALEAIISRRKPALESARQGIVLVRDDFGFFKLPTERGQKIDIKGARVVALVPDNGPFAENLIDAMKVEMPSCEIKPHYFPYRSAEFTSQDVTRELSEKIQGNFYNLILKELAIPRKEASRTILLLAFARAREAEFVAKLFKKLFRNLGTSMPPTIFIALGAPNNLPIRELVGLKFTYLTASSRNSLILSAVAEALSGKLRPGAVDRLTIPIPPVVEKISPIWDSCH